MAPAELLAARVAPDLFRETLSRVPTGLTVVTTMNGDERAHATTVSAFCSLSLDPPLVLVALDLRSNLLCHVRANGRFGVNLLSEDQQGIGLACGRKGPDKLAEIAWRVEAGLPRLEDTAGWLACDVEAILPGGDHQIVVGRVGDCSAGAVDALVFHRRGFHRLTR